uniref:SOWAHA-C winged helix-turn-helix domain-containing protein n=1 Tax=Lepisosteus oculatus TaxID=7918 RepID=W5M821_LEPOC
SSEPGGMATEFSQASVLDFLCRRGGKVKNADLLRHFHAFLRDPEKQAQNRDLFKRFVNSVAVVKNEGGVSSVALKRKYRDLVPDFSSAVSSSGETEDSGLGETFTNRRDLNRKPEKGQSFKPSDSRAKRNASENNNVAVANPRVSGESPVLYTTEKTPSSKTDNNPQRHCNERVGHRALDSARSLWSSHSRLSANPRISGKHSRLLLLSSSLGLGPALAPRARAQSYREISQGDASRARPVAAQEGAYRYRSTPVPLDSREHDWLVKAAAGTWTEIYSLFREQPSLLGKKDFVSGYTVLHWIAKHGDHQVLNTLWYGVSKAGLELDVNVKSSCGYTPLHIAAIHGHKKLIRVLVHKFKANPSLRDTGGKRPWHYLARTGPADLLQLLGA